MRPIGFVLLFECYVLVLFLFFTLVCTSQSFSVGSKKYPVKHVSSTRLLGNPYLSALGPSNKFQLQEKGNIKYGDRKHTDSLAIDPRGLTSELNSGLKFQTTGAERDPYDCKKNDSVTQQACMSYCIHFKDYKEGICSQDQRACLCRSSGKNSIRVKLYKPVIVEKVKRTPVPKKVISNRGDFDCDGSLEAKSICQVYCDLRGSASSECTMDGKSCLCFVSVSGKKTSDKSLSSGSRIIGRRRRQLLGDGIAEVAAEEKVLEMGMGRRRRPGPLLSSRPVQLSPYLPGCNQYSCLGNCPRHCDSLCTMSMECYCSCPEDAAFYDYPDPGYGSNYDFPFYG